MLAVESKKTDKVDLLKPLQEYIAKTFPEQAGQFDETLAQLQALRESMRLNVAEKSEASRDTLVRYFGLLQLLEKRFPVAEEGDAVRLSFAWYDAFRGKKKARYSLQYEKANVLFNLGALLSQLAVLTSRDSADGLRKSAQLFQQAAGTYEQVRELLQTHTADAATSDLCPDSLSMLSTLLLAQAQQCFLQKAIKDQMKPSVLSKLAAQVADYYDAANALLGSAALKGMDSSWSAACVMLSATFAGLAHYQHALALHADAKYGDECAQLLAAVRRFDAVKKRARDVPEDIADFVARYQALVAKAAAAAERDNDTIYHELVPAQVAALERKAMVKPLRLPPDTFAISSDPFAALVPFAATQAASVYSEKKAQLVRGQLARADEHDELAKRSLASLGLPAALLALDHPAGLPPPLAAALQRLQADGGMRPVEQLCAQVAAAHERAQAALAAALQRLDEEERADAQLRAQHPGQWTRTPSHTLTHQLRQEAAKTRENLDHARKSNALVLGRFEENRPLLAALCGTPEQQQQVLPPPASSSATLKYDVATLKALLSQLENLLAARATLITELKAVAEKDDIIDRLLASHVAADTVYTDALRKYDPLVEKLKQNCDQQQQILNSIASENQRFTAALSLDEQGRKRQQALQRLDTFFQAYQTLRANLREGAQFYKTTEDDITHFARKCEDFCLARQLEMQEALQTLAQPEEHPTNLPAAMQGMRLTGAQPGSTSQMQQPLLFAVPNPYPTTPVTPDQSFQTLYATQPTTVAIPRPAPQTQAAPPPYPVLAAQQPLAPQQPPAYQLPPGYHSAAPPQLPPGYVQTQHPPPTQLGYAAAATPSLPPGYAPPQGAPPQYYNPVAYNPYRKM